MTKREIILVTGAAGFIGFSVSQKLLNLGYQVVGLDNFNDYYDVTLKETRIELLKSNSNFKIFRGDISDEKVLAQVFTTHEFGNICHLAAQAGVRHSIDDPLSYIRSNIVGFTNLLETAKDFGVKNFIFASSSSVYGDSTNGPFAVTDNTDHPLSIYAATKKADELIAHTYHKLFAMNCTALRFFSVYGPWGRPDMAYFSFARDIMEDKPIALFNRGHNSRDFTYIDDIVDGIILALNKCCSWEVFNLGSGNSIELIDFLAELEKNLGKKARVRFLDRQPGDAVKTLADISHTTELLGYEPKTTFETGIRYFSGWFKEYYR